MMALSRRRLILFAIAAAAGALFLRDVLSESARPRAATAAAPAPAAGTDAPGASHKQKSGSDVAAWLKATDELPRASAIPEGEPLRDVFLPTPALLAVTRPRPPDAVEASAEGGAGAAAFERRHTLTGVVVGRNPSAVIDGVPYGVGEWIDGFELIEIRRDEVLLRGEGGVRILRVAERDRR